MSSPTAAIWRLRKARRAKARQDTAQFAQYKEDYLDILAALKTVANEDAVDELSEWMIEWTHKTSQLPPPAAVQKKAQRLCSARGISIPDSSRLVE